jgi:DNA-binding YbaB/EbfC family protein
MFGDLMGKLGEMQQRMEDMKKRLDTITVIGEAGSGMVKATVTGNRKLVNLQISPELLQDSDAEAIEDLVTVAVNRALEQAEKVAEAESTAMGKDMLPGFPGLGM